MQLDDWKSDQYRWHQNGCKQLPESNPIVQKRYFVADTPEGKNPGFKRHAYKLIDATNNCTLVHYLGDDSIGSQYPHGNCKAGIKKPFVGTCPSVFHTAKQTKGCPTNVYKRMVADSKCSPDKQPVLIPRNPKQISNLQAKERQSTRLTHDALYNLHELAYDLDGYVSKIVTFPDLLVICGLRSILAELNRIISATTESPILLSYDTTFKLGDFYVSPFLFRHVLFEQTPTVPAAFVLHERKFQTIHEEFMKFISRQLPALSKLKVPLPIVVDNEAGLCHAIDNCLPGVSQVQCWNHLLNSVKLWLRRHGANSDEIPIYASHLRELFHQESELAYQEKLKELSKNWSKAFVDYYMQNIHEEVSFINVVNLKRKKILL